MLRHQEIRSFSGAILICSLTLALPPARNVFAQENSSNAASAKQTASRGVIVWDTRRSYKGEDHEFAASEGESKWVRVPIDASNDHRFSGDCVVENEHLWLRLPASKNSAAFLWGKTGGPAPLGIALYEYDEEGRRSSGAKSIRILRNANHEAVVEYGVRTPRKRMVKVEYRVASGKHWIEAKPAENAGRLGIGVKSQLVIVPNEFGEDFICDSRKQKPGSMVSLPRDNLVIALNCDGNFMSVLTYPSIDQAGDVLIGSDQAVANHGQRVSPSVAAANAKFDGKSVFVGLLPHQDNWYCEGCDPKAFRYAST